MSHNDQPRWLTRWPIRDQILVPFAATVLTALVVLSVTLSWLSAQRREQQTISQLRGIVETLNAANFPLTESVLQKMHGLSGAEFVVLDGNSAVSAATLTRTELQAGSLAAMPMADKVDTLSRHSVRIGDVNYYAARIQKSGNRSPGTLLVLYPEETWRDAQWNAAGPPLMVGTATLVVIVVISAGLAARIGRRIQSVRHLFTQIADGHFEQVNIEGPDDELADLVAAANRMSAQLRQMQSTIRDTERMRLLAQLAGGLAHQLRNEITGIRMAVQLHQRRFQVETQDDCLNVALRQLELMEEHIKGLLAMSRREHVPQIHGDLCALLREVEAMLRPSCDHARVELQATFNLPDDVVEVHDADAIRITLVNLALNAMEATGPGGNVSIDAHLDGSMACVEISDDGPGPSAELQDSLFEPFSTSKPEGIGLGLALARQTAASLNGTLTWRREGGRTIFSLALPVDAMRGELCAAR